MSNLEHLTKRERITQQIYGSLDRREIYGELDEIFPDFITVTLEHLHGEVFARPGLGLREREICIVAAQTAMWGSSTRNIRRALRQGVTQEEILEIILQVIHYCGWPHLPRTILGAKEVFSPSNKRGEKVAITDSDSERLERGQSIRRQLGWYSDKPGSEYGDKATTDEMNIIKKVFPDFWEMTEKYLMGDIWSRPGLSLRERVMVSMAAIIALGRPVGLKTLLRHAAHVGISRQEILEIIMQAAHYCGWPVAVQAILQFNEVLTEEDYSE